MQCLAPSANLTWAAELVHGDYSLSQMDSLPSMPLAMFDFDFLEASMYQKMSATVRTIIVTGLLFVVNFFRELISAYGLAIAFNAVRSDKLQDDESAIE